jgi:uncharacterized delta-60 repeat protein
MSNAMEDAGQSHLAPGFLVGGGRFALLKQIGEGGMGTVWLAQDERLNERVALKFLSANFRTDATALSTLRLETQKSRKLTHPNIIRIHDLYESPDEVAFISMEYVEGMDLAQLRAQQPNGVFTWEFLQPIVKQLCDALDYAHGEDVVHRDLKPSNMILDARGRLKLADFGLAGLTTDPYASVRPEGYFAGGTIQYMSPQQLEGLPAGIRDDIYALGVTLYELVTSRTPFYSGDVATQIRSLTVPPITDRLEEFDIKNEIPRDVRALILACLSKDPEKRPVSARAVAEWIGLTNTTSASTTVQPVPVIPAVPTAQETLVETPVVEQPAVVPEPVVPIETGRVRKLMAFGVVTILAIAGWFIFGPKLFQGLKSHDAEKPYRTIDTSFDPGAGANVEVRALAVQKDGRVVVGGRFTLFNGERHVGLVRLNKDGSVDRKCTVQTDGVVWSLALQADEKILIAGNFENVNGEKHSTIARLNADLTVDSSFDCDSSRKCDIRAILPTKETIFVGGPPMIFHGVRFDRIARLDLSGSAMEGVAHPNGNVWAFAFQTNGQLIVGGEFNHTPGAKRLHLMRLNADGAVDPDYAPNPNARIFALTLQPDGKLLAAGGFDRIADTQMRGIARLNPDGAIDKTFNPGSGADSSVQSVAVQSDGKILIGGTFHEVDGTPCDCIARLNADGTVDQTFAPQGIEVVVRAIALAADGNIIVGGSFTNVDGVVRQNIVKLKASR